MRSLIAPTGIASAALRVRGGFSASGMLASEILAMVGRNRFIAHFEANLPDVAGAAAQCASLLRHTGIASAAPQKSGFSPSGRSPPTLAW